MFDWLIQKLDSLWKDFVAFITDLPVDIVSSILNAVASIFESIPVPSFVTDVGLSSIFNSLPSGVVYFLIQSAFVQAFSILGLGFTFRMLRKLFTLGQW